MDIWLERHPSLDALIAERYGTVHSIVAEVHPTHSTAINGILPTLKTVRGELRRIRYQMALEDHTARRESLAELRRNMRRDEPYRDTRPEPKRKYVRRRRSVAEFTAKQKLIAERILNGITLHTER